MPDGTWFQVDLTYAVFGVKVINGRVAVAAPIARWMIGKQYDYIVQWVERKGGTIKPL